MSAGELVVLACWVTTALVLGGVRATVSTKAEPRVENLSRWPEVVCRVPRDPSNRWLDMGILGTYAHGIQLDGRTDAITFRVTPPPFGCEPGDVVEAFCRLVRIEGGKVRESLAVQNLSCRP